MADEQALKGPRRHAVSSLALHKVLLGKHDKYDALYMPVLYDNVHRVRTLRTVNFCDASGKFLFLVEIILFWTKIAIRTILLINIICSS